MKKLITILLIFNLQLLISNCQAQSPVDSVGSGCDLDFNGISNFVGIPHNNNLNFGLPSSTFSMSAWIKTGVGGVILSKSRPNTNTHMPYILSVNNAGNFVFWRWFQTPGGIQNVVVSASLVNDNKWHHVTFVNENASVHKIYIDGILDTVDNVLWSTNDSNTEPVYIGKYHKGTSKN